MIIFRFIYYVFLKPIGRVFFGMPEYQPKKKQATRINPTTVPQSTNPKQENRSVLKGHAFEEFIAIKINQNKGYVLKEWRGDKYADGTYAESNLYPDLEFEVTKGTSSHRFAIECKWRNNFYDGKLELFKESQLTNYWRFSAEKNIPVFVAIGVGRDGPNPKELFVIPLSKVKKTWLFRSELQDYRLNVSEAIYYNHDNNFLYGS